MNTIRLQILTLFLALISLTSFAQTPISGMINSDSILRKSNSPYLVTSDLVVFPAGKLTIESGVEVRFALDVKLEIRGRLIAEGAENDTIIFTSDADTSKDSWVGIIIKNTQGGTASFSYCKFSYADTAIYGLTTTNSVSNSNFSNNNIVFSGVGIHDILVDSCRFENNNKVIWEPIVLNFSNCIIKENIIGIGTAGDVTNCHFEGQTDWALTCYAWADGQVLNNIFIDNNIAFKCGMVGNVNENSFLNNEIAIIIYQQSNFTIQNNIISNNVIGIQFDAYSQEMTIVENQICKSWLYNIKNNTDLNFELYDNCWCTSDSLVVEDKIYDGYDCLESGLVDYTIYSEDCLTKIMKTFKLDNSVYYYNTGVNPLFENSIKLYPNPASDHLFIDNGSQIKIINVYSYLGDLLITVNTTENLSGKTQINISSLAKGLYLVELLDNTGNKSMSMLSVE